MIQSEKKKTYEGPWTFIPIADKKDKHKFCVLTHGASAVASVYARKWKHGHVKHDPESLVNARLIAAAPELLKALQSAMPLLFEHCGTSPENTDAFWDAKKAITKATKATKATRQYPTL